VVGLEMVLVVLGHVIEEDLILIITISREMGPVVHLIKWHLL
jgi:hypothetical protein